MLDFKMIMHWITVQFVTLAFINTVKVSSPQELNSTLHLTEYGVPYAFVGETIIFTCRTERSNSIGWSSEEYIGENRLDFASVEPDGTARPPTESGAVAQLISSYRVNGTVVLVSRLQITVQSVHQIASVTCHNIGIDNIDTSSFSMADNTSITCDAPAICPGEIVSCACITAHSNTLAWSSDQLIGNGGAELAFNFNEPLRARQNASNMNTFAVLSNTSDENGVLVLKSELSFVLLSTSFNIILTCENTDRQNSRSIILPIHTEGCPTAVPKSADPTTIMDESIHTTSTGRLPTLSEPTGVSGSTIVVSAIILFSMTTMIVVLIPAIYCYWKIARKGKRIRVGKRVSLEDVSLELKDTRRRHPVKQDLQKPPPCNETEVKSQSTELNNASLDMSTGDVYAIAEKKQKKKGPTEAEIAQMYVDPSSIQHETAPTGDVYAVTDKKPKKKGPTEAELAQKYSVPDKTKGGGERIQSDCTTRGDLQKQPLDIAPEVNSTSVNDQAPTTVTTSSLMCDKNDTTTQTIPECETEKAVQSNISTTRGMEGMTVGQAFTCSLFEFKPPLMIAESETGGASSNIAPTTKPMKESSLNDVCMSTDKNYTTTQEPEDETYRVVHVSAPNLSLPGAVKPKTSTFLYSPFGVKPLSTSTYVYSPSESKPPSAWMIEKREEQAPNLRGQMYMYTYGFESQIQRLTEELQERKCEQERLKKQFERILCEMKCEQEQLKKQFKRIVCEMDRQKAKLQEIEDRQKAKLQEIEKCAQEQQLKQQLKMMQYEMEQQIAKLQKGQAEMFLVPASVANEAVEANMAGNWDRLHVAPAGNF